MRLVCLVRAAIVMLALVFLCSSRPAMGQAVNATLLGTVTDATSAAVSGAKVTIHEVNTGVTRTTLTNDSGNYTFPTLTPGTYDVTIEKEGFRKAVRRAVDVLVNTTVRVDMQLEPGTISEQITVTAEVPLLQTDRTDTGRKLE